MTTYQLPLGAIVVGVDGSSSSEDAVHWAVNEAASEKRALVIVHATGRPARLDLTGDSATVAQERRILGRQLADEALRQAHRIDPHVRAETLVLPREPEGLLADLSQSAHLVVVGARGEGGLGRLGRPSRLLLGSVSLGLTSNARCPVVVVRPELGTTGIVLATDAGESSAAAMEFAAQQASLRGLPLRIVQCFWDGFVTEVTGQLNEEEIRMRAERSLAEAVAGLQERYVDVPMTHDVVEGPTVARLLSESEGADLLVLGSHGRGLVARTLVGSVSRELVSSSRCTVAVVHP